MRLFVDAKLDTLSPKSKFFRGLFFRNTIYNALIINILKKLFLRVFHIADYQTVTGAVLECSRKDGVNRCNIGYYIRVYALRA